MILAIAVKEISSSFFSFLDSHCVSLWSFRYIVAKVGKPYV